MTSMWGSVADEHGMNTGETTLMGPSIWGSHNQHNHQSWNIPSGGQSGPVGPQNSTFPPASNPSAICGHNPKSPWDPNPPSSGWQIPVSSTGSQNASGWGVPGPTMNGWGVPPPQQPWNPNGASPGGASFADAARKNVPAQAPPMRPNRPNYDTGSNGWGSSTGMRVDQHTPWDCGQTNDTRQNEWRSDGTGHWGDPRTQQAQNSGAQSGWGSPPSNVGGYGGNSVQQAESGNQSGWGNNRNPVPVSSEVHWGGTGQQQGGWGNSSQPPDSGSHNRNNQPNNWELHNPQHPGMWVPPAPQDVRDDMMWHDPNPKTKKVQPDKGTGCWGDPACQGAISRWKASSDDTPPDQTLSAPPNRGPSVWGDSPAGPQPPVSSAAPVTRGNSAPGWGVQEGERPQNEWGAATVGDNTWNPGSVGKPSSGGLSAVGGNEDRTSTEDNVFSSNPSTPMTPSVNNMMNKPTVNGPLGKGPEVTLQDLVTAQGNGNTNFRNLTQQIAEQLRVAVEKGLIDISILTQPLPQNVLLGLNQLLSRVPKLEQANKELKQLQVTTADNPSPAQLQEQQRLNTEISRLQMEIQQYQKDISNQTSNLMHQPPGSEGSQASEVRSKLDQWKSGPSDNGKLQTSASTPNLEGVDLAFRNLKLDPWGVNKLLGAGGADWSPPSTTGVPVVTENGLSRDITNGDSRSDGGSEIVSPVKPVMSSETHGSSSATPTPKVEGPKEFIPGQKWEWRDPKEVAEDPNATPGSQKLSVGSIISGTASISSFAGMGIPLQSTPPKLGFDPRPSVSTMSPNPNMYNADPIWGMRGGRHPVNQPFPGLGAPSVGFGRGNAHFNRSISTPINSAFAPYATALPTWVVLGNLGQADEQALKSICTRIARVSTFACPPGGGFACVRFSPECSLERIMPRLQHEVAAMGVSVQLAKDSDVDRLLQAIGGRSHSMMPPGHGIIWPDQGGAPWGAPPFAGAGPMLGPEMMGLPPPHMQESFLPPHGDAAY